MIFPSIFRFPRQTPPPPHTTSQSRKDVVKATISSPPPPPRNRSHVRRRTVAGVTLERGVCSKDLELGRNGFLEEGGGRGGNGLLIDLWENGGRGEKNCTSSSCYTRFSLGGKKKNVKTWKGNEVVSFPFLLSIPHSTAKYMLRLVRDVLWYIYICIKIISTISWKVHSYVSLN